MENDNICDAMTESERRDKSTTSNRNKRGRPTKAECLNSHKLDAMQAIPELLEKGRTNERKYNQQQEIKELIRERFRELRREGSNREILSGG